jgi:hypothetical protein
LEEHDLFALAATYAQGVPVSIGPLSGVAKPMKTKRIILCAHGLTHHPDDTARKGGLFPANRLPEDCLLRPNSQRDRRPASNW